MLSPEIPEIIEADVFHCAEGSMKDDDMVSHHSLYRGGRPWHDMRWNLCKLGRSSMFSKEYAGTSQNRRELADDIEEVGLLHSTRSIGKLCTWGREQQCGGCGRGNLNNTRRL